MTGRSSSTGVESKPVLIPYKRSQRPSWSCTECARRKIRCDKKVPCASCVKRGKADHCRLEGSSYEVTGPSSQGSVQTPDWQGDDGHAIEAVSTPSRPRRFSFAVHTQGGSGQHVEDGTDVFLRGLSRLQQQLDRIEERLNKQARQEESIEDVRARLNDVEEVISVLGENRADWATTEGGAAPKGKDIARTDGDAHLDMAGEEEGLDDCKVGTSSTNRLHPAAAFSRAEKNVLPAMQPQERNAELASTDAATTLEFLTLGKDRRRDVDFGASSSDSETESSHPTRSGSAGTAGKPSVAGGIASLTNLRPEAASKEFLYEGRLRMLKHLRRGLPSRIVSRIEHLLRSRPDELPPANLLARPAAKLVTDGIKAVILSPAAVRRIVGVAKEIGAWQHCCVHFPTFEREVEAFLAITLPDRENSDDIGYESYRAIDPAWLSLYYVICSIAIHQMSEEEGAFCGLGAAEAERMRLASILLHAAMESLSLADYLVKPSVYCCQTIAILCVAGHNICGSDLLTSLLAIGIKTAQTLGLHALGRTARFLEACAMQRSQVLWRAGIKCEDAGSCRLPDESPRQFAIWKKRIIDLEVGKRVWWAFTQQDYFAIPFSGCFSIVEGQYDTPLPHNCSDEDLEEGRLVNREVNELTVASKQRFTCHVAKIVCDFFEDLNKTRGVPSLALVKHHESRLRFVTDRFKACLDPRQTASSRRNRASLPSFTTVLQHYLFISVQHKILVMHRAFLSRDVSAEERQLSHSASIETARGVLQELERGLGLNTDGDDRPQLDLQSRVHGGALWTIPYHSVAAATILALDMFQPASHESHRALRRQEVKRALEALGRFTKKSAIARRGCQLLADLLEEGERYSRRPGQPRKRRATDGVDSVLKRIRLPENEDDSQRKAEADTRKGLPTVASTSKSFLNAASADDEEMDKTLEASWFTHLNPGSTRSVVSSALAEGTSPDDEHASVLHTASFGYGSSNFNPLAGNSTSRAGNSASFHPGEASNSLSSMFLSYDSGPGSVGPTYDASPASSLRFEMNGTTDDARESANSASRNASGGRDRMNTSHGRDALVPVQSWPAAQGSTSLDGVQANNIPGMNLNMPQQQLAQILPALESMPDVWKLFDGTLGQSLVAFEESGF